MKPPQLGLYSLGPLMSTSRSPVPAFLVSTLKSPTCFTLNPEGCRPRPVALHAPATQAVKRGRKHTSGDELILFTQTFENKSVKLLEKLTRCYVHIKGALGDPNASKCDGDEVLADLSGPVGAAIDAFAFVFHHHLHAVLAALRVSDHGRHFSCTGSCRHQMDQSSTSGTADRKTDKRLTAVRHKHEPLIRKSKHGL